MDAERAIQASIYRLFSIGSPEVSRHLVKGLVEIAGEDPLLGPRIASTLQLAAEDGVSMKAVLEGLRELEKAGTSTAEHLQTILGRQASQSERRPTLFCPVVFKVVGDF